MFFSLAILLAGGLLFGEVFKKLHLPALAGMLLWGIAIGPYGMNWLDDSLLTISADLRQIALIIILIRAGLNLDLNDLKKVGRPAVLMCFLPATFEIIGCAIAGPWILGLSLPESLLLGSVLAAVSPAVVVPYMVKLMDEGYGTGESVPQMILAGTSLDDIYVIVLFSCFSSLVQTGSFSAWTLLRIPTSIVLGAAAGIFIGMAFGWLIKKNWLSKNQMIIVILAVCFALIFVEKQMEGVIGFSGLLGVMALALVLSRKQPDSSRELSSSFDSLWAGAQIFLFVLVGASVNLPYAAASALGVLGVLAISLAIRMLGVWLCTAGSSLDTKERVFCLFAYSPKATVQAAIGGIPLAMGLACGQTILSAAVLAILITAPLGALLISSTYKKLLKKDPAKAGSI